jgi:hypothetical protein
MTYGCTDPAALNYNLYANVNDGSCKYTPSGNGNGNGNNGNGNNGNGNGSVYLNLCDTNPNLPFCEIDKSGNTNELKTGKTVNTTVSVVKSQLTTAQTLLGSGAASAGTGEEHQLKIKVKEDKYKKEQAESAGKTATSFFDLYSTGQFGKDTFAFGQGSYPKPKQKSPPPEFGDKLKGIGGYRGSMFGRYVGF